MLFVKDDVLIDRKRLNAICNVRPIQAHPGLIRNQFADFLQPGNSLICPFDTVVCYLQPGLDQVGFGRGLVLNPRHLARLRSDKR